MKLSEFLTPEHIFQGVELSSKKRVLEYIGQMIAQDYNQHCTLDTEHKLCPIECFSNLFKREKLGSTSINHGIAIPHAKLPHFIQQDKPIALFIQLETAIDFEASDNKEVDLIFAIMFPEHSCQQYKGYLSEIAQKLSDRTLARQLRLAQSAEEIWQILVELDNSNDEPSLIQTEQE